VKHYRPDEVQGAMFGIAEPEQGRLLELEPVERPAENGSHCAACGGNSRAGVRCADVGADALTLEE
jgi:hypothetical protein